MLIEKQLLITNIAFNFGLVKIEIKNDYKILNCPKFPLPGNRGLKYK
jgi:hypothetical protein